MSTKYALIYRPAPDTDELAGQHFQAHFGLYQRFLAEGRIEAFGPFEPTSEGSLAIFPTREDAEAFMTEDPFLNNGVIAEHTLRTWNAVTA
ncbi:YciI family protein [Microbacterium sp. NPDC077663]|uniref:YciI family protein n=1 Tax=Microbacterium sp. NPDC077663 TaxID=3364189 RepID=UPI0037CBEE51